MSGLQSSLTRATIRTFLVSRPLIFPSIHFKKQIFPLKSQSEFRIFAADGSSSNNNTDPIPKEAIEKEQGQQQQPNGFFNGDGIGGGSGSGGGGGGGGGGGDGGSLRIDRVPMFNFKWGDLLKTEPDNIVVVGSTSVLTWASVAFLRLIYLVSLGILLFAESVLVLIVCQANTQRSGEVRADWAKMGGGMEANKNKFIEEWGAVRENLEYNFRWTRRSMALIGIFGVVVPVLVYKGIVKEFLNPGLTQLLSRLLPKQVDVDTVVLLAARASSVENKDAIDTTIIQMLAYSNEGLVNGLLLHNNYARPL